MVGSVSSELRRPPARARPTRSRSGRHELGERLLVGVVDGRRDQAAAAQRDRPADVDAGAWSEAVVDPEAVELRHLAQRERRRLEQQRGRQQALVGRPLAVERGSSQVERAAEIDGARQVVVRDLALRAAHRRGDRLAHLRRVEAGRARRACGAGLARPRAPSSAASSTSASVTEPSMPVPVSAVGIDAELGRPAPRGRRYLCPRTLPARRCRHRCCRRRRDEAQAAPRPALAGATFAAARAGVGTAGAAPAHSPERGEPREQRRRPGHFRLPWRRAPRSRRPGRSRPRWRPCGSRRPR